MLTNSAKEKMNILLIEFNEILGSFRIQYETVVNFIKKHKIPNSQVIIDNFIKHFLRPYLNIFLVKLLDLKNDGKITEVWIFTTDNDKNKYSGYIDNIIKNIEIVTNTEGLFDHIETGLETKKLQNYFTLDDHNIIFIDTNNQYRNSIENVIIVQPYLVMYSPTTLKQFLKLHFNNENIIQNIYIQLIHKYRLDTTYRSSLVKFIHKNYLAKCFSKLSSTSITYYPKHDDDTLINLIEIISNKF